MTSMLLEFAFLEVVFLLSGAEEYHSCCRQYTQYLATNI